MPKYPKKRSATPRSERKPGASPRRARGGDPRAPRVRLPEAGKILDVLAAIPGGGTSAQVVAALKLPPTASRDVSGLLRRLVEQGQVLEVRPGRYQPSGSGGEHAIVLENDAEGKLVARFPDDSGALVHPRHTLGARAGDVCQAVLGEDGFALVTRILRRSGREIVGVVTFRPSGMILVPDNRREGDMPVLSTFPEFQRRYRTGDRVVGTLQIDPEGRPGVNLTSIIGDETPEVADFRYACLTHDLPGDFPAEVEREAAAATPVVMTPGRLDLRDRLIFTIDPATAKDFDDAVSIERRPQGGWIIGVHIADVSHYVREETAIDGEAAARGTSIYLINRVIPMLPEVLSNGLCSLVPRQDRYCLSAFIELDQHLRICGKKIAETIIHSRHRLTYEQAMDILDRKDRPGEWPDDLTSTLRTMGEISQGLRKARERAGALNLYSVEHRFSLDVNGQPVEVGQEVSDPSHQLIEEFMLLANRAVAEWLTEQGFPCVFRIHAPPDAERMKQFAQVLETAGFDASGVYDRFGLQRTLKRLDQEPKAARIVLNFMCLRSFKKAVYAVENIGHYALAFEHYAHFTSPIRRYPDLLVHRLAKRALGLAEYRGVEMRAAYLDALAKQASWLEQRAEGAERTLHARKSARYLGARIGERFPAVVAGAMGGGLFVQLLETGMEGLLPVREMGDDYYEYDPERLALVGTRSGRVWGPGAELDVIVQAVDIDRSDVTFGFAGGKAAEGQPTHSQSIGADLDRLINRQDAQERQGRRARDDAKEAQRLEKARRQEEKRRAKMERRKERKGD